MTAPNHTPAYIAAVADHTVAEARYARLCSIHDRKGAKQHWPHLQAALGRMNDLERDGLAVTHG